MTKQKVGLLFNQTVLYRDNYCRIVLQGNIIIFLFFGLFGILAIFGELSGAIVTPGTVRVDTYSKKIQHLEGGIIDTILVKEGSKVSNGQTLLILQDINTESSVDLYRKALAANLATQARLYTERELFKSIDWPAELLDLIQEYKIPEILDGENKLFHSRMDSFQSEKSLLEAQILQIEAQIIGLQEQCHAEKEIIATYHDEYRAKEQLYRERFLDKSQLFELKRRLATHKGTFGKINQNISELSQKRYELKLRIQNLNIRFVSAAHKDLSDLERQITQIREQIKPLRDAKDRLCVISPVSGYVVNLKTHTKGGVIKPGEDIMAIVPDNIPLIVEAKIPVDKITDIYIEQKVQVQMDAFDIRTTPLLSGKLIYISADRIEEQNVTGSTSHYLCHVEVSQKALAEAGVYLSPGMPATVYITTQKRSILSYMLEPLLKNWKRALRD